MATFPLCINGTSDDFEDAVSARGGFSAELRSFMLVQASPHVKPRTALSRYRIEVSRVEKHGFHVAPFLLQIFNLAKLFTGKRPCVTHKYPH